MVVDIPTERDFIDVGENLLNAAWNSLAKLLDDFSNFDILDVNDSEQEKYWLYAKPTLLSSFALVQQAVEFYLKSKILAVSPYLLISLDSRNLPRKSDTKNISFSEFRTIDAQDLIKVVNTFSSNKLGDDFKFWFNGMRAKRNAIIHTVDHRLTVKSDELAVSILCAHQYLVGKRMWVLSRNNYLRKTPTHGVIIGAVEEHEAYICYELHKEMSLVIENLKPCESKSFFGFNKRKKSVSCNRCYEKFEHGYYSDTRFTDELIPSLQTMSDSSERYRCFICNYEVEFTKTECSECERQSINKETNKCVWCAL